MHAFADLAEVEITLKAMGELTPPLVVQLPRARLVPAPQSGSTCCSVVNCQQPTRLRCRRRKPIETALVERVAALEAKVAELEDALTALRVQLGA